MRLPTIDIVPSNIDEQEAMKMIRYAIDKDINYINIAYSYLGKNGKRRKQ